MSPTRSSAETIARVRRSLTIVFAFSIVHVAIAPLFTYYWTRDNNGPALAPGTDYRVQWIPDHEFRGLDAEKGPTYAVPGGNKTYAAGPTWQLFRPYYVSTPDGKWHFEVLARGPMFPTALRTYAQAAVPSVVCSVLGMVICLYGLKGDSSRKAAAGDPAFQDLG